jgi:hypothetical protein
MNRGSNIRMITTDSSTPNSELKSESQSADDDGMSASAIALQGLDQANTQLNAAAAAIATAGTGANSGDPSLVNLAADIVSLTSAQTQFEANIATLKTSDQMEQSLINVTA